MTFEPACADAQPRPASLLPRRAHASRRRVRRVLMTADAVGGVWSYALTLAGALAQRGVRTCLAVFTPGLSTPQREEARDVPGLEIHEGPYRLEWMDEPWEDVRRSGEWLLSLARMFRPDVVHLNGYSHGALSWPAPAIVVAHSCVCSWWEAVHGVAAPPRWNRYRAEVRRGLQGATQVVAPTRAMLGELERIHGPLATRRVVHNARAMTRVRVTREAWVLTAGRIWDEAKNVRVLEVAARRVRIRAAGEARDPAGHDRPSPALELLGRLGSEEMREAMGRAAVYAHPAVYEPFGLAPLEAALQGCALVLSDIPSLRELWEGAAVFVPPREAPAWAAALEALMKDAPRRRRLAEAAGARAATFRPERQAEEMLRIYDGALARARREALP